jgi:hypothetical protein
VRAGEREDILRRPVDQRPEEQHVVAIRVPHPLDGRGRRAVAALVAPDAEPLHDRACE